MILILTKEGDLDATKVTQVKSAGRLKKWLSLERFCGFLCW
jgi:hypothetical protein